MKLKHYMGVYFLVVLLFSACMTNPPAPAGKIAFLDTDIFDKQMSSSMSANLDTIEVAAISPFSVNRIPERLGKWLSTVNEGEGTIITEPKTRSFIGVLSALPPVFVYVKDRMLYGPGENYNATIHYNPKSGLIEKVVFSSKTQ
ncbi:MAG: hypothetical protein GY862_07520 [Gammaproteobacteria bacterium]|nr:hypothetical protein [Gammaproteobacteria bacterium]